MRPRRRAAWLLAVGAALSGVPSALAATPRDRARVVADELTALPGAGIDRPLRRAPALRWVAAPGPVWTGFVTAVGGKWSAAWDAATGVPSRIWGTGIPAPGATRSAELAERAARRVLADHLALLAPGSAPGDFELVSNHFDGDTRSVGFVQRAGGLRVVGGQISFRFKADRLFVIGSEALPHVGAAFPRARLGRAALLERATSALRRDLELPDAPVTPHGDEVILPLIGDHAVLGYRVCAPLLVDGGGAGRYVAYVDPATGDAIAVHQRNRYATGTVLYRVVDRYPGRGRLDRPAAGAFVKLDGAPATTAADGTVAWAPDAVRTLATSATGELVTVVNRAPGGAAAAAILSLAPGGSAVWDASASEHEDAQVNVFHAVNTVKEFIRTRLDPGMPGLGAPLVARTNLPGSCNAFFDGTAVNFLLASTKCQNTGLLEDIVYHEVGHLLHEVEVIPGVGVVDGAMGEGAADFLATSITGDSGMGRGYRFTDAPLRELDPPGMEHVWPRDIDHIHVTGLIYAGALWDLRKAAIAAMGETDGVDFALRIYLATLRRAANIPTSFIEALAADDDDGDLANGTPNECLIRAAFGRHGLRGVTGAIRAPGAVGGDAATARVDVELAGLSERCPSDAIQRVTVSWAPPRGELAPAAGTAEATLTGPASFRAEVPLAPHESITYRVEIEFADGSIGALPDNRADPAYQLYQGATIPLYCTSFDADPFAEGWSTGTSAGGASPWQWGIPAGGAGDPAAAFSGTHVLALALGGAYPGGSSSYATLPPIDVGAYSDVRLQYRRWLTVEDRRFDTARVIANGGRVWENASDNQGNASEKHHVDREWRFHDVPLSGWFRGHEVTVGFELQADGALEYGGWTIDDLCVVANPLSVCGDGVRSPTEQCDDGAGNADAADRCRTDCLPPACGDGIVDRGEECDGGPDCSVICELTAPEAGGCCSADRRAGGSLILGALAAVLLRRRRRRPSPPRYG